MKQGSYSARSYEAKMIAPELGEIYLHAWRVLVITEQELSRSYIYFEKPRHALCSKKKQIFLISEGNFLHVKIIASVY